MQTLIALVLLFPSLLLGVTSGGPSGTVDKNLEPAPETRKGREVKTPEAEKRKKILPENLGAIPEKMEKKPGTKGSGTPPNVSDPMEKKPTPPNP